MEYKLLDNEHFTLTKNGQSVNVEDTVDMIPALQTSIQELAVGIACLSVKANEWVGVGTWGDTLSWPTGNVWPTE